MAYPTIVAVLNRIKELPEVVSGDSIFQPDPTQTAAKSNMAPTVEHRTGRFRVHISSDRARLRDIQNVTRWWKVGLCLELRRFLRGGSVHRSNSFGEGLPEPPSIRDCLLLSWKNHVPGPGGRAPEKGDNVRTHHKIP